MHLREVQCWQCTCLIYKSTSPNSLCLIFTCYPVCPDDDGGNGSATISTKQIFDREKRKYYYIPIVMWDMRGKNSSYAMTGTNTLTVTIADVNDNLPHPGHQDIFVYNYKGKINSLYPRYRISCTTLAFYVNQV